LWGDPESVDSVGILDGFALLAMTGEGLFGGSLEDPSWAKSGVALYAAASSRIGPSPSKLAWVHTPHSAAAASNRRPTDELAGLLSRADHA